MQPTDRFDRPNHMGKLIWALALGVCIGAYLWEAPAGTSQAAPKPAAADSPESTSASAGAGTTTNARAPESEIIALLTPAWKKCAAEYAIPSSAHITVEFDQIGDPIVTLDNSANQTATECIADSAYLSDLPPGPANSQLTVSLAP